jgi:hypothetical protein
MISSKVALKQPKVVIDFERTRHWSRPMQAGSRTCEARAIQETAGSHLDAQKGLAMSGVRAGIQLDRRATFFPMRFAELLPAEKRAPLAGAPATER